MQDKGITITAKMAIEIFPQKCKVNVSKSQQKALGS
jgi:hypothetical protein